MPRECGVTCSTSARWQVGDGFDSRPITWSKLKMLKMVPAAAMSGALQNNIGWRCLDPKTSATYNQAQLGHSEKVVQSMRWLSVGSMIKNPAHHSMIRSEIHQNNT